MSEEFKDANIDESNMNVDDNVQYSSWQEAIGAIRTELLDRVREEVNQSLSKGLSAILTTLDTKMQKIVSSKMDDDMFPEIQIHGEVKEFKVGPENETDISFEIENDFYEEVVFSFEQPTLEDIFEESKVEKVEVKQLTLYSLFNGMMQTFLGSKDLEACAKDCFAQSCFSISIAVSIFILRFHEFQLGRRIWNPGIIRF